MFHLRSLLIHSADVPAGAKRALEKAGHVSPEHQEPLLQAAARALHLETSLTCAEALELVGLSAGT